MLQSWVVSAHRPPLTETVVCQFGQAVPAVLLVRCAGELRESLTPDDVDLVLASAVLADRELLRAVHAIPAMHAAMGPWRN